MYKKIILFVWLWLCVVISFAAGTDYSSLSNNLALAPGLQGTTQGYDLLSGKVTQNIPLVKGNIPFTMQYHASLRLEGDGGVNLYQELDEGGIADWSNEYSGYVITSIAPSTNVSTFILKLPDGNEKYIITKDGGKIKRLYYNGAGQFEAKTFYSENLKDISFNQVNGSLVIIKDGIKYTASISKTLQSVFDAKTIPAYLFKFTEIQFQDGRKLSLTYDNGYNLIQVKDNRNNILNILREYKKIGATTQSYLERKLITGVELISGSNSQKSKITYQEAQATSIIDRSKTETRYTISAINSVVVGTVGFKYENQSRGYWIQYIANNTGRSISTFTVNDGNYPILNQVLDQNNNSLRLYEYANIWQFYGSSTLFLVYTTQITSYSTVNNQKVQRSISMYDDMKGNLLNRFTVNGQDQVMDFVMTPPSLGIYDESNLNIMTAATGTLTVSGNYPGLLTGSTPIRSVKFNPFTHRLLSMTDFNGNISNFSYDNKNRLIQKTVAAGNIDVQMTTYIYTKLKDGSINDYTTPNQIITESQNITNTININGWIETQIISHPRGGNTKILNYTYYTDPTAENYGLIKNIDGPSSDLNDNLSYTYDGFGNKNTSTQTVNNRSVVTKYLNYNSFAQPERIIYPSGLIDQFIYNLDGTINLKVNGSGGDTGSILGAVVSYTYDYLKRVKSETNPDGEVTTYDYDILGRLIKTIAPNGSVTTQSYFDNGIVQASEGSIAVYNEISSQGRISKNRNGTNINSNWKTYSYDGNGNITQTQTALGIIEKWTYDALNRNTSYTDGEGNINTKAYDKTNNVISAIDAVNSGSMRYTYTNSTLLISEINNEFGEKRYDYNDADQIRKTTHSNRICTNSNIDNWGRIGGISCSNENGTDPALAYNYQYIYDSSRFGRLDKVSSTAPHGVEIQYTYDNYDRVIGKTQTNKSLTTWNGVNASLSIGYTYTAGGKVTGITLPSGRAIAYNYEGIKGRLAYVSIAGSPFISNIAYDVLGQLTSWNILNTNASYMIDYDTAKNGAIKTVSFKNKSNSVLYREQYEFDKDERVITINQLNNSNSYGYDGVGRLTSEKLNTYFYDRNGNRKNHNTNTYIYPTDSNLLFEVKANNVTLLKTTSYSSTGELRFPPFISIYDGNSQMRYSGGENSQYYMAYNHKNERTVRSINTSGSWYTGAIQYLYDENSNLVGEYAPNGTPIIEYVWMGSRPIAAIYGSGSNTKIYTIITDRNNTPRMLVDNSNDAIVWQWQSTAFGVGKPVGSIVFNLRFPGQYYDAFTGLHYNLNRYYNPELGRYMEPDPIGLEGGSNPYVYADNNPISNIDPTGLQSVGQILDQNAMNSAMFGNSWSTYGWSFAGTAWNFFGAESVSLWADGQSTSGTGLGFEFAAAIPFVGPGAKFSKLADVAKYEVGTFDMLKGKSVVGDGLDIHHAMQKNPAQQIIYGYNPATAPSIALPRGEHSMIPTIRGQYNKSARSLLAKDIMDMRNYTNAPNSSLRKLIMLNKNMYPDALTKVRK